MAEEFVRIGQFEEFSRRIDERFLGLEKKMEQGFAHAAKERENILVQLNQRLDDMKESVNKRFDGVNQRFDSVNQRFDGVNQRFGDLTESMNQRFDRVNQRFDDMKESVSQRFDTLEKMVLWQNRIAVSILLVILAAALKYLFFPG